MRQIVNLLRWRRRRMEQDLDRELRYHLDRRIEDMMKAGLSEVEARRRASIELGLLLSVVGLYGVMSFVVTNRNAGDWGFAGVLAAFPSFRTCGSRASDFLVG
jgi:hypothetical protein